MLVPEAAPNPDERQWGMFAHLSGMLAYVGFPFGGVLGPLIIYNLNKDDRPFASEQGRQALNFHLTVGAAMVVCLVATIGFYIAFIADVAMAPKGVEPHWWTFITTFGFLFAFLAVYFWTFVLTIVGTVKASAGKIYHYPLTIEFVKR